MDALEAAISAFEFRVVFRHRLDAATLMKAHGAGERKHESQTAVVEYGRKSDFEAVDIFGSATAMEADYRKVQLHIGYLLHAHLSSIIEGLPSILLTEDGRRVGAAAVGGAVVTAPSTPERPPPPLVLNTLDRAPTDSTYLPAQAPGSDLRRPTGNEVRSGFQRSSADFATRDPLAGAMARHLGQLP